MPRYETQADLLRESATKQRFIDTRPKEIKMFKLPDEYKLDFFITDAKRRGLGVAEVKCRTMPWNTFDTVMINAAKFNEGLKWCKNYLTLAGTTFNFLIITSWKDKCMYYKYDEKHKITCDYGGRTTNTRRARDIAPVVHIPNEYFTEF